jgi:hypothetical protein
MRLNSCINFLVSVVFAVAAAPGALSQDASDRTQPRQPAAAPQARSAPIAEPAPRSVEQARPAPRVEQAPQPERPALSRAPRRVAPSGPDPLQASGRGKDDKGEK